jgi:hypothetical protein
MYCQMQTVQAGVRSTSAWEIGQPTAAGSDVGQLDFYTLLAYDAATVPVAPHLKTPGSQWALACRAAAAAAAAAAGRQQQKPRLFSCCAKKACHIHFWQKCCPAGSRHARAALIWFHHTYGVASIKQHRCS